MTRTWKELSRFSQRRKRTSAGGWILLLLLLLDPLRICKPWFLLLLHVSLPLPHNVLRVVDPRGAKIPDACALTAADDQLLQVSRPAAERALRQDVLSMAPAVK